jgi:hypothetical protein
MASRHEKRSQLLALLFALSVFGRGHGLVNFGALVGTGTDPSSSINSSSVTGSPQEKVEKIKLQLKENCACVPEAECAGQPGLLGPRETREVTFEFSSNHIASPSGESGTYASSSSSSSSSRGSRIVNRVSVPSIQNMFISQLFS